MGKKSRQKRDRRIAREAEDPGFLLRAIHARQARTARGAEVEKTFQARLEATRYVLRRYKRLDAAIALGVSDLWPANTGSPIKHIFALGVLLGLEQSSSDAMPIASYAEFKEFVEALYTAWPEFPSLEDFTPEADWGQVRVRLGADFVPMFYGSCIERTPDFVESFRITYAHLPEALAHMNLAVAVQASIIGAISHQSTAPVLEPQRGQVKIPPEGFWESCRTILRRVGHDIADWRNKANDVLEARFGSFKGAPTGNAFGDAAMQGMVLPFLAVVEGDEWVPVSVRSGPGVVVDHWAAQHLPGVSLQTHRSLARFVAERVSNILMGPLALAIGGATCEDLTVSCVISADAGVYLICACDHASTDRVARAAKAAYAKLGRGAPIHFRLADGRAVMVSKNGVDGPSADELRVLIVVTQSSTAFGAINVPERPARLMPLADFITIFDALDDLVELERYWQYVDQQRSMLSPFSTGPADLFASFKDSHGVLVEGAMLPTWITLDPHWGTTWRFRELSAFWSRAPHYFPDGSSGWKISNGTGGVVELTSRHHKAVAYSTMVGACTAQAMVIITPDMEIPDGRMVDMFAQLLADSMYRCRDLISDAPVFGQSHLVFNCKHDPICTIGSDQPPEPLEKFPVVVTSVTAESTRMVRLHLKLDTRAVLAGLNEAKDGSFEIRCLMETLAACHTAFGMEMPMGLADRLRERAAEPARYHLKVVNRYVDVPDYVEPVIPSPTEYKQARKHLAMAMKALGLTSGRYELSEAKAKIDPASQYLRKHIENRLALLDRYQLLEAFVEQHDALLIAERLKVQRARQSLAHAVEYDRLEAVEHAREEFGTAARHYRYLLEKVASSSITGMEPVDERVLRELVGLVDWYMVLTGASDVLHNGVDVGGVEIDDSFIPNVFYSSQSDDRDEHFAREYAKSRLGIDTNEEDAVEGTSTELLSSQKMREAFLADLGFELQHLINALAILSQSKRFGLGEELALSYSAEPSRIAQALSGIIEGLQLAEAIKIVHFLTLSESDIRRLPGRDIEETDVPYWEHRKRIHRYAIRPLVACGKELLWGAEQASRAMNIWMSSVRDGYLPADFDWPNVVPVIREVKEGIEKRLEIRTEEIFKRHTPYAVRGMDFFKKFRSEGFEDVGDFDVLAYWPETNMLVTVECKYNQPPYTVKDSRRLRDRIFGQTETDKAGHLSRILRRRKFVESNRPRMLELLKWPAARDKVQQDVELYVSRDTYYWMIHPPYPVPTKFVRVDELGSWITNELIGLPDAQP